MKHEPESVIVCEGYHDRSFLRGWLGMRGCEDLKNKDYRGGKPLKGKGQYAFKAPNGGWMRIVPVDGDGHLLPAANIELAGRETSLPAQQTLERLVCAALAEAYGSRCKAVADWIASRPEPPGKEKLHKTHAASHMAGWFSDRGDEGLFEAVWEDAAVRRALLDRLGAVGATRVVDALVGA